MKKVVNKTVLTVILVLSMLVALCCGLFTFGQNRVAEAAGKDLTVKIEALDDSGNPVKSFAKGSTFTLKVTVTPNVADNLFDSLTLRLGVLTDDKSVVDTTKCGYFTFTGNSENFPFKKSDNIKKTAVMKDQSSIVSSDNFSTHGFLVISLARTSKSTVKSTEEVTLEIAAKVNDDVPDSTEISIGVLQVEDSQFTYRKDNTADSEYIYATDATKFECTSLDFTVKEPSNVCTLASIKAGQDDNEANLDEITDLDAPQITVYDITKPISIYPTLTDANAKIELLETGAAAGSGTAAESGKVTKFDIPDDGKIRILVTAENGTDTKEYVLTVNAIGAKLTALTANTDSKITGIDSGLKEEFDSATFAYTVIVPSDSTKVTLKATLSSGHGADSAVYLKSTGSCSVPTSANSAADFDVTGIKNADTLTITARALDGTTPYDKDYVITFNVVDVDTDITLSVVGSTTKKTFANDEDKAKAASVDYYYVVAGETNASSTVTITYPSTAQEIKLDGTAYTAAKTLTAGDHTVTVKAEAGNTKDYKFTLKNYMAIKLKDGVTADFLQLKTETSGATTKHFRVSYKQLKWKHGVDDLTLDKFVIGNIKDYTPVNDFLSNFDVAMNTIKLYKADGTLIYDCGNAVNDYTTADLADQAKPVGTGWKLEYVVDGNVEETIYLSVLGDLDGDGVANSFDMNVIIGFVKLQNDSIEKLKTVEIMLAGLIQNKGQDPNAADIGTLGLHIQNTRALSTSFDNYEAS